MAKIHELSPDRFKSLLSTLSEPEQKILITILKEYAEFGDSETERNVWLEDYEEIPVDIDTFLEDDAYLGKVTRKGTQIYPFWRTQLRKLFTDGDMDYEECVFTGAIGIGKTQIAVYAICYLLYRIMCLQNPQRYFGFADTDTIAVFFFNATIDLAMGVGFARLHACCMESPWFLGRGEVKGSATRPYYVPGKHIAIKAGSNSSHALGQQVVIGFLDEVNFAPGQNATIEKSKIMKTYSSVKARIKSRFIKNGKLLGRMFMVSSKHAEHDFLEVYIQRRMGEVDAGKLFLVDEPLWVVKPSDTYSGKTFQVAYGAKQLMPQMVEDNDDPVYLEKMGFKILDVPIEFYEDFKFNIITSLQDLAGIALPGTTSYFSYRVFSKCYIEDRKNPFTAEVLQIGLDDDMEYEQFFEPELIPKAFWHLPISIHVDTSLKHDLTGITAVAYLKNMIEDSDDGLVEKRVYEHLFSVGIQAPPGSEISLAKSRRFIYRLRALGFNIVIVSTDTFQSAEFHQILKDKGFSTAIRSLDRTPEGYKILREAMIENRIHMLKHTRLETELIHLQRDTNTGKLDHPVNGCFTIDTKIRLVDGRALTIGELLEEQQIGKKTNWVYTVNEETGCIEPKPIVKVFPTKQVEYLTKVTLDNGAEISCTPEHLFMLRDGSYCEAQNLRQHASLMPLYTRINQSELAGYREFYNPGDGCWYFEHRRFCHNYGTVRGNAAHHQNFNPLDNTPTNLLYVTHADHMRIHNMTTRGFRALCKEIKVPYARKKQKGPDPMIAALRKAKRKNHKVVSVDVILNPCTVYDLEIKDNHNFALDAGVFVHNSKDISDSLAGAVWDLSLLPYQPALTNFRIEYTEKDDNMPECFNNMFNGTKPMNKYQFDRI